MSNPLHDDSPEAIRNRVAQSIGWPNPELAEAQGRRSDVSQELSDQIWRAVQDRRILLEKLDELAPGWDQ